MRFKAIASTALFLLIAAACTANSSGASDSSTTAAGPADTGGGSTPTTVVTGPAPGVTDTSIKVGITYVDLDAVRQFVDLDQGDYKASYQAVIDKINAGGGINGRKIDPVYAAVSPLGTAPADEVCVRLTEDEHVFAVIGFFQDDAVLCPVANHKTAVIGGVMTRSRHDKAQAPWFTTEAGEDSDIDALDAMAKAGELTGKLGVFASIYSQAEVDATKAELSKLGIKPADLAILDAPTNDLAAQNQATSVIAERFRSEGIDRVLVVGSAALPLANGLAPLDYRPKLLFTSQIAVTAYTSGLKPNLSMFKGAVLGSINNLLFKEPAMEKCVATLKAAGLPGLVDPLTLKPGDDQLFVSGRMACINMTLFETIAKAAGKNLNYGTFQAAGEGLGKVHLPGAVDDYDYGPYPKLDGDQKMFLWDWDASTSQFKVRGG